MMMKKLMKHVLGAWYLVLGGSVAFGAGPLLVPDYDRDGVIDKFDFNRVAAGEQFTVWLNDDDDAAGTEEGVKAGDTNNDLHDVPGGEGNGRDCEDVVVNGRCDLLDFFPALVDVNGVDNYQYLTWKLCGAGVNVVFTTLKADYAGDFHTREFDAMDGTPLYRAAVTNLTEQGVVLPEGFLQNGWGVFVFECAATNDVEVMLCGYNPDGGCVCSNRLNLAVRNVEEMYGWMNLRPEADESKSKVEGEQWTVDNSSVRLPPSTDSRHFVFVHGYNTNHEEARGNAAEFYKKLWQSGFDGMFTAVEWYGNQSQIDLLGLGIIVTPNYYVNVENAFAAAKPFADACAKLPGEKILVGHSLGNVLISSAIKDHGLDYTKYVMLNAAVAREAFDANAYDEAMVPKGWRSGEGGGSAGSGDDLTNHLDRAARWYRNFADKKYDPYEYRRKLAWRGRFANLPRTVNYYSQSDNVLVNPDPNESDPEAMFDRDDQDLVYKVESLLVAKLVNGRELNDGGRTGFGFWAFSEKIKGTWLLDTINDVLTNGLFEVSQADAYRREGGWGENDDYDDEKTEFDPANTRFTPFLDERMTEPGMLDILPAETERLRPRHLADAIPAESFAAGANPVATLENVDMEGFIGENNEEWPLYEGGHGDTPRTNVWNHSTFREVAFYHTAGLYASLAAVGKTRVIIDTDLGSCMDDLFAIDIAARMHKQGKLDLLAVMMDRPDNSDLEGRGEFLKFADRYLASLGLGDLPIGTSMPLAQERLPQTVFNPYWTLIYSNNVTGVGSLMPTNRTDAQLADLTNAVVLYRRLLNDAPDKSVVICSTGFLQNLKMLMESGVNYEGDAIASTGLELIAAKVKELRIMGGRFDETSESPGGTDGAEYNLAGDPVAAKMVLEGWPSPVVVSPWEVGLKLEYLPEAVLSDFPAGTPDPVVRAAYTYWPEPKGEAMNRLWDLATILPLTEGETLLPLSEMGGIAVDEHGVTTFTVDPSSNRCYQVASNMNATAVMNRFREICRTGNAADTVVYGTIRTAETANPVAEAIAIKGGKYVYVGDEDGAAAFIEDGVTKVVDHRGKGMVMPGCTDGHSHYTMKFGLDNMKGGVMFALEDDTETVLQKVDAAALAAAAAGKRSLFGFGWNIIALRMTRKPALAELDAVTHGVSTVIFDQAGHSAFCNSECLKRCGIIDGEGHVLIDKIDGGLLELDDNGYPTGFADERVTGYLTRMGGIDADEIVDDEVAENTMRASQALLLSTGYTIAMEGWSNMLHPGKLYEAAHRMDTNGTLKLVFPMTYEVEPWQTNMTEQIDYLASLNGTYRTRHVLPEYLKIFMDGVVETRTGALSRPYRDGTDYKSFWPVDRLAEITADCNARGLTVHTHVMGDAAIKDATDAYIKGGDGTHRNCLVHLRNVRPEDFRRFADNNIACTAGFTWHVANGEEADAQFAEFLDDEYIQHAYPMKSFFDAGVRVSSHSDFPANIPCPQDPFGIMEVAVTGQIVDPATGELIPPFDTNELVTVEQVFQALTLNGAWQMGLENERGSIAVGKWADFVLADQDVFTCATTDIHKTKVVSTWFEGEKVYEAPAKVSLPAGVQGYSYVVSNLTAGAEAEIAPTETTPGGATYELLIGAKIAIYAVPAPGYVVTGTNPYVIDEVTAETTLEGVTLPAAVKIVAADTVVYGTIRTAEEGNPVAEAIAIKDGKYVYVGDEAGAAAFVEDGVTKVVDHRGKGMVMPGCTDGHSHYAMHFALPNMNGGVMLAKEDDKAAILEKLKAGADAARAAGKHCIFGFGWDFYNIRLGEGLPLNEIDEATKDVSTVIFDSTGHNAYCNSECLKRCKIISEDGGTVLITKIDGGVLELDENDYPTGFVDERVTGYLMRMGGVDYDELVNDEVAEGAIRKTQELLLSTGYTIALEGWSNQLHPSKFYEAAHRMDTNGELKVVFPMTYEVEPWQTNMTSEIDYLASLNDTYGTNHVLPSYLKVFMDGCVETFTGALTKPYKNGVTYKSFWSTNRLADITRECNAKGLTVHTHTMGDAAIKETTDAYIHGGDGTHRNCLVHLRNVDANDFQRMTDHNIACTAGITWHVGGTEALIEIVDQEYVDHSYPIKSFFDAGVKVSSHSDFPANKPCPQDPFGIIEVAVTGLVPNPPDGMKPFDTDELITVEQAFQALTLNGAWQMGLEKERGSIAVGKWADFVLADQDVFECEMADIGKTKVVSTWFEGEKVYQFVPEPFPVPVITLFKPDFTQGPTTEVPNVSWKIEGPFDRVALTIDKTTVYEGNDRNGEGRWRDLRSPGTHRLKLTVGYGDEEVTSSCFYTALLEGEEPALMPMIGYFYPDYYVGKKGTAPLVHWDTLNITSLEIWLDSTCILVTQNASGEFRFSQLNTPGSYVVRMVAHNVIDDAEASFCYRCEAPVQDQLTSAPLLGSAGQPPVIQTFEPDAYDASIRQTPYIRWNISAPVDALKLVIDDIPVFIGDGSTGNGRWLDVSGLKLGELTGSHEVSLSVSNSFGVATSNFTCTCYWEKPPPPPKGSEENPWRIGEDVQAYTNGLGGLIVSGSGATSNYTDTATVPWTEVSATIKSVSVPDTVEVIGDNLWAGLAEDVVINGETIARRKVIAAGFPAETPSGAVSPAEFERVSIVDGVALLDVSVYTSNTLTNENWSVATNGVIEVPAPGKQGFFYLMSKPSVPSNKPIVPPPLPIEQ